MRCVIVVARRVLESVIDLIPVGWVFEGHAATLPAVLAFEETRKEWQAPLGVFGCE